MEPLVLTGLIFQANMAIDEGHDPDVQTIANKMHDGELVDHLQTEYPDKFYFSKAWYDDGDIEEVDEAMKQYGDAHLASDEYSIDNNGLCYVTAILTELVQEELEG